MLHEGMEEKEGQVLWCGDNGVVMAREELGKILKKINNNESPE